MRPRLIPLTGEDICVEVVLPMLTEEIYRAREWISDITIELQDRYGILIMASAIP